MKKIFILMIFTLHSSVAYAGGQKMDIENGVIKNDSQLIYPVNDQRVFTGPEDWFTGEVKVELIFPDNDKAHFSGAKVTFQPGARTNWHLHPAGQHMIVTSGVGLTGTRDGKTVKINVGDAIWCPPDIDHWHGATPETAMTHIVITGSKDGKNVVWKEKVTDEDYKGTLK